MKANVHSMMLAAAFAALATTADAEYAVSFPGAGGGDSTWTGADTDNPNVWSATANWNNSKPPAWYLHGSNYDWYRAKFNLSSATTINMGAYVRNTADATLNYGAWGILVESGSAQLTIEPGSESDKQMTLFSTSGGAGQSGTSFANYSQYPVVFNLPVRVFGWRAGENGVLPYAVYNANFAYEGDNGSMTFFAGDTGRTDAENTSTFKASVASSKPISIEQNHIVKIDGASASMTASGNDIAVAGSLQVLGGSVTCANLSVAAGGTLGGSGSINAAVSATSGAILDFGAKTALTFAGTTDLTGFTISASNLDPAETYVLARGTTSLPAVPVGLQSDGWMAKAQDGNVVLKNTAETVSENVTLTEDTDWSENFKAIAAGVTVDLNGHELKVAGVSLGAGAAFVNSGAKANLVIGCNGGDKSFIFDTTLPSSILLVFTGAAVEIPSGFIPAGGIGFKDIIGEQLVYHESCANGLAFLGNAAIAEAGDEWTTQGTSLAVSITGTGNTLHGGDLEAHCWRNLTLTGDGYLTMQRNGQWSIGFSGNTAGFSGTLHIKHVGYSQTYFGIGLDDLSFENGTIILEAGDGNNVYFSNYAPVRKIGNLSTAGDNPEKITVRKKNAGVLHVGYLNNDSTFGGQFEVEGVNNPFDVVKEGSGTWTLSGAISGEGTLSVDGGEVNFAGATFGSVSGLAVGSNGRIIGTSTIPATIPVSFADGATVSGSLTFKSAPTIAGTAKLVPEFSGSTVSKLTFDYASPSLAAFAVEAETIPVVAAGTEFVIAEGPVSSSIIAPTLGTTAIDAGWEVRTEENQVILTSTKLPPLDVSGEFSLSDDYDYSTGTINVADGAVIDLCGHTLKVGEITFAGAARFTNSAATVANLVAGCEGNDKSWLWTTAGLTLDAGVRAVITGAAVEVPADFVPAGGIGFKDTTGTTAQFVSYESCVNGVAFLGNANVTEPLKSWQNGTFTVSVYGANNVFVFNADNTYSRDGTFANKVLSGDGTLTLRPNAGIQTAYALGNENIDNSAFTGTLILEYGTNFTMPIEFCHPSNKPNKHYPNATVSLCGKDDGSLSQYVLASVNGSSTANFCFDSLVTEGDNAANVSLFTSCTSSGGTVLRIGCNGNGGGVFAGTFTNYDGTVEKPYSIEKNGTNVWTLTGTVANGGAFNVNEGTVCFNSGLSNVSKLTVASGATAGFCGNMGAASAMNLAAGSKALLDVGAAARAGGNSTDWVPVVDGDLDLSGVGVVVKQGSWTGNRSRDLLRVTGTLTVDLAQIETDLDTQHFKFQVRNGNTLRYQSTRGFVISVR